MRPTLGSHDACHLGLAKLRGGLGQRIEHRLQIEGRVTDHLEHVGGGGLLREQFAQLVEQPRVLDGDDRLVGKGRHQLDLFRRKWLRHGFIDEDHPYDDTLAQERDAERSPVAAQLLSFAPGIVRVRQHIGNLNHPGLERGSPGDTAAIHRDLQRQEIIPNSRVHVGRMAEAGGPAEKFALALEQPGVIRLAQPRRQLDQGIEHGLQIEGRAADHLEHVGGGGLLLQRFGELLGARLHVVEQPHVLDRDHRLVGERLHEADLRGGEWFHLAPPASDNAYRPPVSNDGNCHEGPIFERALEHLAGARIVIELRQDILEVYRATVHERPAHDEVARRDSREQAVKCVPLLRRKVVEGYEVKQPVVEARNRAKARLAQTGRICDHGLEHRLHVGRRTGDDA